MSHGRVFKILILLLTVSIILTASIIVIENSSRKINGTYVSVLPANVIWEKTYGVVGDDDLAYSALPVGDGYLVVG